MVRCSIIGCKSRTELQRTTQSGISFFKVPSVIRHQCSTTRKYSTLRRQKWIEFINREDITDATAKRNTVVCSLHFISGRAAQAMKINEPDWVPSLLNGNPSQGNKAKSNIPNKDAGHPDDLTNPENSPGTSSNSDVLFYIRDATVPSENSVNSDESLNILIANAKKMVAAGLKDNIFDSSTKLKDSCREKSEKVISASLDDPVMNFVEEFDPAVTNLNNVPRVNSKEIILSSLEDDSENLNVSHMSFDGTVTLLDDLETSCSHLETDPGEISVCLTKSKCNESGHQRRKAVGMKSVTVQTEWSFRRGFFFQTKETQTLGDNIDISTQTNSDSRSMMTQTPF